MLCSQAAQGEQKDFKVNLHNSVPLAGHRERVIRDKPQATNHQLAEHVWPMGRTLDMSALGTLFLPPPETVSELQVPAAQTWIPCSPSCLFLYLRRPAFALIMGYAVTIVHTGIPQEYGGARWLHTESKTFIALCILLYTYRMRAILKGRKWSYFYCTVGMQFYLCI